MRGWRGRGALVGALAGTVVLGSVGVAVTSLSVASPAGASSAMVAVASSAPRVPAKAKATGAVSGSTTLHVAVALKPADPAGLEQLATEVSTPGGTDYHHYLTPTQVQAQFGPSPATLTSVRTWLSSEGLSVGAISGDGLDVPASGPASAVEAAFHAPIDHYTLRSGRSVYANAAPPEVPASLQPSVTAVLGLDDIHKPHNDLGPRLLTTATPADLTPPSPAVPGAPSACTTAAAKDGNTASDMGALYDLDPLYQQGRLGQGITVGLFENGNYNPATIAAFEQCYGISTQVTTVPIGGGSPPVTTTKSTGEVLLDIETVAALAPDATILDYEGNDKTTTFANYFDIYAAMVQQNRAQVLSTSWGFTNCELGMIDGGVNLSLVEAPLFQEMAVQGQSMLTASGDQGSEGCASTVSKTGTNTSPLTTPYGTTVEDPADQPFITVIGGTMVDGRDTVPDHQVVWNQSGPHTTGTGFTAPFDGTKHGKRPLGYPGNLVGSGGVSAFFQQPPWQVGFSTGNDTGETCGAPVTVTTGAACREVPDASGLAWSTVGYYRGHWTRTGGTSAASPQWAAFLALVDQGVPQHRLGLVSPALYEIDKADPSAFTDIVKGQNDYLSTTSTLPPTTHGNRTCTYTVTGHSTSHQPCYRAVPGYDMATGLGTPNGAILAADLEAMQVGITTTSLPGATLGQAYSTTVTASGGTTPYTWGVTSGSLPPGLFLDPATGAITGTPTRAGTFPFSARVTATGAPVGTTGTGSLPAPAATAAFAITVATPPTPAAGYWEVASDGGIFNFGTGFYGSMGGKPLNQPIVGIAVTPTGTGYYEVASDGGIFAFGSAEFYGSMGGKSLNKPIVGIAATPTGGGYWEVASDGGIFAFGDAQFYGSHGWQAALNAPIVGLAATPTGGGYWEVASDGGIFAFGNAQFYGSMGGKTLNQPIVGIAVTPTGTGYYEVASDGGIFALGSAQFYGSMGGKPLNKPIVGIAATPTGNGYWEVASDGGIFAFGDAPFEGSVGGLALTKPVVGMAATR